MKRKILSILCLAFFAIACNKEDIMEFTSDDAAVFFQASGGYSMPADGSIIYQKVYSYSDSTYVSFAGKDESVLVASIPLKTMGKVKNYDRPVKVVIDKEASTAVEGVDYQVNLDTVNIPADKSSAYLRVSLIRTDELLEKTKLIVFRLEENEHFKMHIQHYKASSNWQAASDTLNALRYKLAFNEQYKEPFYYMIFGTEFWGPFTPKKFQVINQVTGWTVYDWNYNTQTVTAYGRMPFAARATQKYLQEMADAGTPVLELDGSFMQLTADYAVDYSKYENN